VPPVDERIVSTKESSRGAAMTRARAHSVALAVERTLPVIERTASGMPAVPLRNA